MRSGYETLNALKMSPVELYFYSCHAMLPPSSLKLLVMKPTTPKTTATTTILTTKTTTTNIITVDGKMREKGWREQAEVLRLFPTTTDTFKATSVISLAINSFRMPDTIGEGLINFTKKKREQPRFQGCEDFRRRFNFS